MINFNKALLNSKIQQFINDNINVNVAHLALKGLPFDKALKQDIIIQIEAKQKCIKKLPTWFNAQNIYFPTKLNVEQTSSETTANYKANLVNGDFLIDLTGGFGVDTHYFSTQMQSVIHCDINSNLSSIVKHNSAILNTNNIQFFPKDGITVLKQLNKPFDWIYIDPSRRNDIKGKVFLLKDCLPNVPNHIDLLFKYSKNIMIKTSPILDIKSGVNELKNVKQIHCIAVNNEVKELLWILEKDFNQDIQIKTTNIIKKNNQCFNFFLNEEVDQQINYSNPLNYLYEPNAAILKSGGFNCIANKYNLFKLHKHSHLYTSNELIDFPGRCFKIDKTISYNKKVFSKKNSIAQANVTIRNFPETVNQIRNKFKIKDGGKNFLFFTTNLENSKIIISCFKI